jgi:hypothetical protein
MTVRPPPGTQLPDLVLTANHVLTEEAHALRAAMDDLSSTPQPGSPWTQDDEAVSDRANPRAPGQAKLLRYTRHQTMLIYANAYDHLLTLARVLGGDEAMPLFSHASISRVVCEAAVRFAWLMDPDVSSATRIVRGAAALYFSADQRSKAVRSLPRERFDQRTYEYMLRSCTHEYGAVQEMIAGAGMTFALSRDGRTKVRLELDSPEVSEPVKLDISTLMKELLPDSPSWYNIGSSVSHSIYWGLRDVDRSRPGQAPALAPNVLDVGASAESAISASGLILDRSARCHGHDPSTELQRTSQRREEIDALMRRAYTSTWVNLPTQP